MKQKLGLACALVATPRLLLLDEPGVGVDPISRRELWAMVGELTGQGIGVLWSTAYLDEAETVRQRLPAQRGQAALRRAAGRADRRGRRPRDPRDRLRGPAPPCTDATRSTGTM